MNVKKESPLDILRNELRDNNGILLTSDLEKLDIPRTYLSILEEQGEIQRISRGIYSTPETLMDEMLFLQLRYKKAIYSHQTALYLHDLSDRSPLSYSATVPTGYNATALKAEGVTVFFVKAELHSLGKISMRSPSGNDIYCFDVERTICDILRSRNKMDIQIITDALKRYVRLKTKNIARLYIYAEQFRIQKIVRQYMETLI